jgi:putative transposase
MAISAAKRSYQLTRECITPSTSEHNGLIERWLLSPKGECVRVQSFPDFAMARRAIAAWSAWCNTERPHQALGDCGPAEYRARPLQPAA